MPTISIPTPLRGFADGQRTASVAADTVGAALQALTTMHPRLKPQILGGDGDLRRFVNVFINRDNIRDLNGLATVLAERDELIIIPSIAGG